MGLWDIASERLSLVPIFGPKTWGANSTCDDVHPYGPVPAGSQCCCMACHQTGVEEHPGLRETAGDRLKILNWKPPEGGDQWSDIEETATAEPTRYEGKSRTRTRRERRADQFRR